MTSSLENSGNGTTFARCPPEQRSRFGGHNADVADGNAGEHGRGHNVVYGVRWTRGEQAAGSEEAERVKSQARRNGPRFGQDRESPLRRALPRIRPHRQFLAAVGQSALGRIMQGCDAAGVQQDSRVLHDRDSRVTEQVRGPVDQILAKRGTSCPGQLASQKRGTFDRDAFGEQDPVAGTGASRFEEAACRDGPRAEVPTRTGQLTAGVISVWPPTSEISRAAQISESSRNWRSTSASEVPDPAGAGR